MEAAERSQRANIAEALRAKLAKLEAERGIPKGGNKEGCKKGNKAKSTKVGVEDATKVLESAKVKTVKKLKRKKVPKKSTKNLPEDPPKVEPVQLAPAAPSGQSPTSSSKSKGLRSKESNQSKSACPKRLKQRKGKKTSSSNDETFAGKEDAHGNPTGSKNRFTVIFVVGVLPSDKQGFLGMRAGRFSG